MSEPLPVRKARAIELKLAHMPTDLWRGQLFAGSMTLEQPRTHAEWGFPDYTTAEEKDAAAERGLSTHSVFGHVVPDYPRLLTKGLRGIRAEAEGELPSSEDLEERAFLDSVIVALDAVIAYAARLAGQCEADAAGEPDAGRATELRQMAENLRQAPAGPARSFWQALQSVWLLHMVFHSTMNGNAMGRLDQYVWPHLEADLESGALDRDGAAELVDCFCLKFNERAQTLDEQRPDEREPEPLDPTTRTRHYTSSQIGTNRDSVDAANHWLQNIVVGGLTPGGQDGTNPLTYVLLDSYRRNQMTNPLLTVRLHRALQRPGPRPGIGGHRHTDGGRTRLHERRMLGGHHPRANRLLLPAPEHDALFGVGAQPRPLTTGRFTAGNRHRRPAWVLLLRAALGCFREPDGRDG
jgi:formate C-acetyltransferase